MAMINLAQAESAAGEPLMSDSELSVFDSAFSVSGFTGSINWYRNLNRNWHLLGTVDPIIQHRALMIYGERDVIPPSLNLADFVPNVSVVNIDAGHCIQQEKPPKPQKWSWTGWHRIQQSDRLKVEITRALTRTEG